MAGGPGLEPGLTESESVVLPLNYPPYIPVQIKYFYKISQHADIKSKKCPSRENFIPKKYKNLQTKTFRLFKFQLVLSVVNS